LLIIDGWNNLQGNWLLIQIDKDTMVFEKGTGAADAYKSKFSATMKKDKM